MLQLSSSRVSLSYETIGDIQPKLHIQVRIGITVRTVTSCHILHMLETGDDV